MGISPTSKQPTERMTDSIAVASGGEVDGTDEMCQCRELHRDELGSTNWTVL